MDGFGERRTTLLYCKNGRGTRVFHSVMGRHHSSTRSTCYRYGWYCRYCWLYVKNKECRSSTLLQYYYAGCILQYCTKESNNYVPPGTQKTKHKKTRNINCTTTDCKTKDHNIVPIRQTNKQQPNGKRQTSTP